MHPLVRVGDTRELQRSYLAYRMRQLWKRLPSATPEGYALQLEPVSAQFCNYAVATITGISQPHDPLHHKVHTTVRCELNDEGIRIFRNLKALGIDPVPLGRGGGGYDIIQNKKLSREADYFDELQDVRDHIYMSPYAINVPVKLDQFFEEYQQLTARNIALAAAKPELLGVGKPLNSGTGYIGQASDREGMIEVLSGPAGPAFAAECQTLCDQYYSELRDMVKRWPYQGGIGYLAGPFKGIQGGSRSDVEVVDIQPAAHELLRAEDSDGNAVNVEFSSSEFGIFQLEAKTREVGNDPSSAFHNHGLTTSADQAAIWTKFSSEYHVLPADINRALTVFTTPPCHMPWDDPEDWVLVSADWGGIDPPAFVQGRQVIIPEPHFTAGAEQVSLKGIFFDLSSGFKLAHLESGTPFTMSHYLITAGEVLAQWARSHGITKDEMWVYQIGDDMHIRIKAKYVELLLADLGHALKLKGMTKQGRWYIVFILGHYYAWDSRDHLVTFMMPRALKSVSSATAVKTAKLPERVLIGHPYLLTPTPEAVESVRDFHSRYADMLYFDGTPEEWRQMCVVDQHFAKMKLEQMTFDSGSGYAMALSESGFDDSSLARLAAEAELLTGEVKPVVQEAISERPDGSAPVEGDADVADHDSEANVQAEPVSDSGFVNEPHETGPVVEQHTELPNTGDDTSVAESGQTQPSVDPAPSSEVALCANFVHEGGRGQASHVHRCKILGMCGYSKECADQCEEYKPVQAGAEPEVK